MAHKKLFAVVAVAATAAALGMTGTAAAASTTTTTVLVTQNNIVPLMNTVAPRAGDTNWYVESRGSGAYAFVNDYGAPVDLGPSSLQLTTGVDDAKVKPMTNQFAGTALSKITSLAYQTYQPKTGQWEGADAAFQLRIDLDGDLTSISDETTLVYEPYLNGTIQSEIWQSWDVLAGSFWSTRASDDLVAGNRGSTMYTLQQVLGFYPKAAVLGIGVNVGGNNANYTVATDGITFGTEAGTTVFNFEGLEYLVLPTNKDECKSGGWQADFLAGQFKNQGDCVSSIASNRTAR